MSRPNVNTAFATKSIFINVPDAVGGSVLVKNKEEPTVQLQNEGFRPGVPLTGDALNYVLDAHHQTMQWLITHEIGTILEFADGSMTKAQIEADRGGVWTDLGVVSRAYSNTTTQVRGFQKAS